MVSPSELTGGHKPIRVFISLFDLKINSSYPKPQRAQRHSLTCSQTAKVCQ